MSPRSSWALLRRAAALAAADPYLSSYAQETRMYTLLYADPRGPVPDPRGMDWRDALETCAVQIHAGTLAALLERVPPGGHVVFVARPPGCQPEPRHCTT